MNGGKDVWAPGYIEMTNSSAPVSEDYSSALSIMH